MLWQKEALKPSDEAVRIENKPEIEIATIRFGGFASVDDWINKRDELIKALGDESSKYDIVNMVTAGYDAPFKFFNRRNEVWLMKKP